MQHAMGSRRVQKCIYSNRNRPWIRDRTASHPEMSWSVMIVVFLKVTCSCICPKWPKSDLLLVAPRGPAKPPRANFFIFLLYKKVTCNRTCVSAGHFFVQIPWAEWKTQALDSKDINPPFKATHSVQAMRYTIRVLWTATWCLSKPVVLQHSPPHIGTSWLLWTVGEHFPTQRVQTTDTSTTARQH